MTPIFIVVLISFVSFSLLACRIAYAAGFLACYKNKLDFVANQVNLERDKWLVKGEKIGFEKGYESGKAEARDEFKTQFVLFLEEQVRILKNQLPAPTPTDDVVVPAKPPALESEIEGVAVYDEATDLTYVY